MRAYAQLSVGTLARTGRRPSAVAASAVRSERPRPRTDGSQRSQRVATLTAKPRTAVAMSHQITARFGVEDAQLGIRFEARRMADGTSHVTLEEMRPDIQQKFPQLRQGLILHMVNGQVQHNTPWEQVVQEMKIRPLELTLIPSMADVAAPVMHAALRFKRAAGGNQVAPAPPPPQPSPQPSPVRTMSPAATQWRPPASIASAHSANTSVQSDFEPSMSVHATEVSVLLAKQTEDATREQLRIQQELAMVEAQMSHMKLLADPGARDPVEALAASAQPLPPSAMEAGRLSGSPSVTRAGSLGAPPAARLTTAVQIPREPMSRDEFFTQHGFIVEMLQDFQKRMSTLDVAQVAVPAVVGGGGEQWGVPRTIDEEILRIQHDVARMLGHDGGGWATRQESLKEVLEHVLALFETRPLHLRRLTGVAKVSLDNRFSRRAVDRLAQLMHEMNMEVIRELRRETARDTYLLPLPAPARAMGASVGASVVPMPSPSQSRPPG